MSRYFLRNTFRGVRLSLVCAAVASAVPATTLTAQKSTELSSLDMWIVQRYRGAQLLPDSGARSTTTLAQEGAPRVEATRTTTRRDTLVALHFGTAMWRPTLNNMATVQLADPTGAISGITGKITARRAFRAPRKAGARDTVKGDWRIGWAYLVAIPARSANASASGFGGWAIAETPNKSTAKAVRSTPPAALSPIR